MSLTSFGGVSSAVAGMPHTGHLPDQPSIEFRCSLSPPEALIRACVVKGLTEAEF